jgi:hypothetical protein
MTPQTVGKIQRNSGRVWMKAVVQCHYRMPGNLIIMVTGQVCGPKYNVMLSLVIVALWPLNAKHVMEKRRLLSPGTYMHPCNSATSGSPRSSNIEIFTFPVVEHQIIWPSATSTPKF